mmetsp:Transcript_15511/g.28121  ORF Transcript_15511/g.28121 Transcript_15511/m.28121 type:complete len:98 (+) Transcript_15511:235-528(+)
MNCPLHIKQQKSIMSAKAINGPSAMQSRMKHTTNGLKRRPKVRNNTDQSPSLLQHGRFSNTRQHFTLILNRVMGPESTNKIASARGLRTSVRMKIKG